MSRDSGVYALLIHAAASQCIAVGALGSHRFPRGFYVYIGSAKVGLRGRIARHRRRNKRRHWHIDYLLQHARPVAVAAFCWQPDAECRLARGASANGIGKAVVQGFGSSDCRCPTHLFRLPQRPPAAWTEHVFGTLPRGLRAQGVRCLKPSPKTRHVRRSRH